MRKRQLISSFLFCLVLMAVLIGLPKATVITGFNSPYDVAIPPSNIYVYVTNRGNNTVSIVNSITDVKVGTITGFNLPAGIAVTPNGTFAYVANFGSNELLRIYTSTNTITGTTNGFDQPYFVSLSPDGKTAYVSNQGNNTVSIVNLLGQPPISAGNPTPQNPTITSGQSIILTANPSDGSPPYSFQWYASLTSTCNSGSAAAGTGSSISVSPSVSTYYCYVVSDSAIPPDTATSGTTLVTVTSPTSTIGGGGGGGGASTGGGGGGGGGGQSRPIVTISSTNCYSVTNIARLNSFNVTLSNQNFLITDSFINPNQTGIIINGRSYTLSLNTTYNISNSTSTIRIINISYLPIQHTVALQVCSSHAITAPQTELTYSPIYASTPPGVQLLSQIDLQNIGLVPEYIALHARNFSNIVLISTNSTFLKPGQSASIEVLLNSTNTTSPGIYYTPIDIASSSTGGPTSSQTTYLTFDVQNTTAPGKPFTSTLIALTNHTNTASGIIQISSPSDRSVTNVTLQTILPRSVVTNMSQIIAFGLTNNVTFVNGSYVITWQISEIPPGQSVYAYFTITKPYTPALTQIKEILAAVPYVNHGNGLLKVINVGIPLFYTNTTNRLYVTAMYTGARSQPITFSLSTVQSGILIYNGTQTVEAQPNEFFNKSFYILTGPSPGTALFNLSLSTAGANISYTLPINILPKPVSTTTIPQKQVVSVSLLEEIAIILLVIIVAVLALLYILKRRGASEPKPRPAAAPAVKKSAKAARELSRKEVMGMIKSAKESGKAVDLRSKSLSGVDLSKLDLSEAKLSRANLKGANLSKANLERADLSDANLEGANLTDANLAFAKLDRANFKKTNLTGVDLSKVDMDNVKD